MKKAFDKLNIYFKCSILSWLFVLVIFLGLIPFFFFNMMDIPLGLLVGGVVGILCYSIIGIYEHKHPNAYRWTLVISIIRLVLFTALLILIALCYYKWEIKVFNIFTYVGGYFVSLIVFIVMYLLNSKERVHSGNI